MRIGVPKEIHAGERRVATTPEVAAQLIKLGFRVAVEEDAGVAASYSNASYKEAGCEIVASNDDIWSQSDVILKVRAPEGDEVGKLAGPQILISFLWPAQNPELLQRLTINGVTAIAMDSVPRISRAQKMDALSSMATATSWMRSPASGPMMWQPSTASVSASARILTKPSASALQRARELAVNGNLPTR